MNVIGRAIARFLEKPIRGYEPAVSPDFDVLNAVLKPGDVVLVEGNIRVSSVIKYLTQSTWSHSAIYVGDCLGRTEPDGEPHVLIEAEMSEGVISSPLSKYRNTHLRICRPVALKEEDLHRVIGFLKERLGHGYDVKNVLDLMRFLVPMPIPTAGAAACWRSARAIPAARSARRSSPRPSIPCATRSCRAWRRSMVAAR